MNTNILVHKNNYSKTHSIISHGCFDSFEDVRFINFHNNIYDLFFTMKPKTIILPIEEYTQEIHTFINDNSIKKPKIVFTVDSFESFFGQYRNLINDLNKKQFLNFHLIVPAKLYSQLLEDGINAEKLLAYNRLYNDHIFRFKELSRNNKVLCILDKNPQSVSLIKPYLYPNSKKHIVMINNSEVAYDQNIGFMLDDDLAKALNTYGSVIDLSGCYEAEICSCRTPYYDKPESLLGEPSILDVEITKMSSFIKQISEYLL
jgi:hypothetical protein